MFYYIEFDESVRGIFNYTEETKTIRMWSDCKSRPEENDLFYGLTHFHGVLSCGHSYMNNILLF